METFLSVERAVGEMGLKINEENSKYFAARVNKNRPKQFQIDNFNFEAVQSFTYLGAWGGVVVKALRY
jgi:hypothetical protein